MDFLPGNSLANPGYGAEKPKYLRNLGEFKAALSIPIFRPKSLPQIEYLSLGADFGEVDLDSNFSIFGVRRFIEWPGPLH